jgi:Mrp family chromosome partitioning ATPase
MSRIFDALRKSQAAPAARPMPAAAAAPVAPIAPVPVPVPAPPPPVAAHAPTPPRTAPLPAPPRIPFAPALALTEEIAREMTTLRVNLEVAMGDKRPRIVMLQSAQGGEGATTVATQFAMVLARDPRLRVLVVDVHARRPRLGHEALQAAARGPVAARNLDVLPLAEAFRGHGALPPAVVREVVDATSVGYDWVVLDGPPVLESPDAASLAHAADGVVLVVQAGRTKRPVLGRAVDLLRRAGGRVFGTVLNRRRLEIPGFIYRRI